MIAPGDIAPRRDSEHELYVAVLSNALHRATDTGRVITCPFIPGRVPEDLLAMVVAVEQPNGTLLPECSGFMLPRSVRHSATRAWPPYARLPRS